MTSYSAVTIALSVLTSLVYFSITTAETGVVELACPNEQLIVKQLIQARKAVVIKKCFIIFILNLR
jgi:hypothetical protein